MLGAFVALLAVKSQQDSLPEIFSQPEREAYFREVLSGFERSHLDQFGTSLQDIYTILFEEEAFYALLYRASYLKVDINIELVSLLDDILSEQSIHSSVYDTPRSITNLMAQLAHVEEGDIAFDPAMGTGGLLNTLSRYAHSGVKFIGADTVIRNQVIVALKILMLRPMSVASLNGSAFEFSNRGNLQEYDVVISNPPVGKINMDEAYHKYREAIPNPSADMSLNFIELGIKHLKTDGSAVFLVNMGALFSIGHSKTVRQTWLERGVLRAIVSLPSGLLRHTGLKCALLIFGNVPIKSLKAQTVRFVKAEDCASRSRSRHLELTKTDVQEILVRVLDGEDKENCRDVSHAEINEYEFSLDPNSYLGIGQSDLNRSLAKRWNKIDDIAFVSQGSRLAKIPEGEDPIIQGRNIRAESLDIENLERRNLAEAKGKVQRTQVFDVLLQRIGATPAAYLVRETEVGLAVSDTVFIIRFKDLSVEVVEFIVQYINSEEVGKRISNARSYSVVPTQTLKSIKALEVPIPEKDILETVRQINNLEASLRAEHEKAAECKRALFSGEDSSDIANQLDSARFTADALTSALNRKDDVDYRVGDQYPFPIAYAYRNIYVERDYASIYERQMKYGEQFLSFLVSVGLSLVARYSSQIEDKNAIKSVVTEFSECVKNGVSPGHWQATLQKCCKLLREVKGVKITEEFSQVWFKSTGKKESAFAEATKSKLVGPLNDFKHHRGPSNRHERKKKSLSQRDSIEELLALVEFSTQWDLILVEDIDKGWHSNKLEITASLLKGDHPAFKRVQFFSEESLSKNKLYIRHEGECIPLYPLLSFVYNEKTKREEIFSFDKNTDRGMSLRSFDSGTSIENSEIASDFERWVKPYL